MTISVSYTTIADNIHCKDNRVAQVGKSDGNRLLGPYQLGPTSECGGKVVLGSA